MPHRLFVVAATLCVVGCTPPAQPISRQQSQGGVADERALTAPAPPADNLVQGAAVIPGAGVGITPFNLGTGLLRHPSDVQLVLLTYRARQAPPPLEAWAASLPDVSVADEFSRPAMLRAATERLRQAYIATAAIGRVELRMEGYLSEYDAANQGFYVSMLEPGSSIQFRAHEEGELQLDNVAHAHLWRIAPQQAAAAFEATGGSRSVAIDLTVRLTGIEVRAAKPPRLHGLIERYVVSTSGYAPVELGTQRVAPP